MASRHWGLWGGLTAFVIMLLMPPPAGMDLPAWRIAALTVLMGAWWMTEALPLTVTAFLPFLVVPLMGIMPAGAVAEKYYSPILFLVLGGALLALAIERVELHRRLAAAIMRVARSSATGLLFAFMLSSALLSMFISNTSTTLIMVPIALAVVAAAGIAEGETEGFAGAAMMGIAFASSLGGLGTLVGSPTNALAAGLIEQQLGLAISFLDWMAYGLPVVILSLPIALWIIARTQRLAEHPIDPTSARRALGDQRPWSLAEQRVVPVVLLVFLAWILKPELDALFPEGGLTDGTIAIAGAMLLFVIPDGTGRALLVWREADRAPWGVVMMFGGGLALAAAMTASGLAGWLGTVLAPLGGMPLIVLALVVVLLTVAVTEFASNVATASALIPVLAALIATTGVDPILLTMPVAMAASWAFMLPSGTGPNAIAWSTGHIALPRLLKSGLMLNIVGVPLLVLTVWAVALVY